jgi:hypothetical protein
MRIQMRNNISPVLLILLGLITQEGFSSDLWIQEFSIGGIKNCIERNNLFLCNINGEQKEIKISVDFSISTNEPRVLFEFDNIAISLQGNIEAEKPSAETMLKYNQERSFQANIDEFEKIRIPKRYSWKTTEFLDTFGIPEILFIKPNEYHTIKFDRARYFPHHDQNENITLLYMHYYFDDDQTNIHAYNFFTYSHLNNGTTPLGNIVFIDNQKNILEVKSIEYNMGECPLNLAHGGLLGSIADKKPISETYTSFNYDSDYKSIAISPIEGDNYYKILREQRIIDDTKNIWTDGSKFHAVQKKQWILREQDKNTTGFSDKNNIDKIIEILEITKTPVDFPNSTAIPFKKGFHSLSTERALKESVEQVWVETNAFGNSSASLSLSDLIVQNGIPNIPNVITTLDEDHITFDFANIESEMNETKGDDLKSKLKAAHWQAAKSPMFKCSFTDETDDERSSKYRQMENLSLAFSELIIHLPNCILFEHSGEGIWSAKPAENCSLKPTQASEFQIINSYKELNRFIYRDYKPVKEINFNGLAYAHFDDLVQLIYCSQVKKIPLKKFNRKTIENLSSSSIRRFFDKSISLEELDISSRNLRSTLSGGISRTSFFNALSRNAVTLTSLNCRTVENIDGNRFISAVCSMVNLKNIDVIKTNLSNKAIVSLAEILNKMEHLEEVHLDMPYWISNGVEEVSKIFFGYENSEDIGGPVGRAGLWLAFPITIPMFYALASTDDDEVLQDFFTVFNSLKTINTLETLELRHKNLHKIEKDLELRLLKYHETVKSHRNVNDPDSVIFSFGKK